MEQKPISEQLSDALVKKEYAEHLAEKASQEVRKLQRQLVGEDVSIGTWECDDSPIKLCCYEPDDYAEDFCIYCGQPDERK